jgi:hypothetical protein
MGQTDGEFFTIRIIDAQAVIDEVIGDERLKAEMVGRRVL